jgi:hypothetical protein
VLPVFRYLSARLQIYTTSFGIRRALNMFGDWSSDIEEHIEDLMQKEMESSTDSSDAEEDSSGSGSSDGDSSGSDEDTSGSDEDTSGSDEDTSESGEDTSESDEESKAAARERRKMAIKARRDAAKARRDAGLPPTKPCFRCGEWHWSQHCLLTKAKNAAKQKRRRERKAAKTKEEEEKSLKDSIHGKPIQEDQPDSSSKNSKRKREEEEESNAGQKRAKTAIAESDSDSASEDDSDGEEDSPSERNAVSKEHSVSKIVDDSENDADSEDSSSEDSSSEDSDSEEDAVPKEDAVSKEDFVAKQDSNSKEVDSEIEVEIIIDKNNKKTKEATNAIVQTKQSENGTEPVNSEETYLICRIPATALLTDDTIASIMKGPNAPGPIEFEKLHYKSAWSVISQSTAKLQFTIADKETSLPLKFALTEGPYRVYNAKRMGPEWKSINSDETLAKLLAKRFPEQNFWMGFIYWRGVVSADIVVVFEDAMKMERFRVRKSPESYYLDFKAQRKGGFCSFCGMGHYTSECFAARTVKPIPGIEQMLSSIPKAGWQSKEIAR